MKYALIQNQGELERSAITTIGFSPKRGDQTKIGQFHTGLANTLTLLARLGSLPDFRIQSGSEIWSFSTTKDTLAGQEFDKLVLHTPEEIPLAYAVEYGQIDWQDPWMCFRELVSNAIDESGPDVYVSEVDSLLPPKPGVTRIYVPLEDYSLLDAWSLVPHRFLQLRGHYKPSDTVDFNGVKREILPKSKTLGSRLQVFRLGVHVLDHNRDSLYDYNIPDVPINECRIADNWGVQSRIGEILGRSGPALVTIFEWFRDHPNADQADRPYEINNLHYSGDLLSDVRSFHGPRAQAQKDVWKAAWDAVFGPSDAVFSGREDDLITLREHGRRPITICSTAWREAMIEVGLPSHRGLKEKEIAKAREKYDAAEPSLQDFYTLLLEVFGHSGDHPRLVSAPIPYQPEEYRNMCSYEPARNVIMCSSKASSYDLKPRIIDAFCEYLSSSESLSVAHRESLLRLTVDILGSFGDEISYGKDPS